MLPQLIASLHLLRGPLPVQVWFVSQPRLYKEVGGILNPYVDVLCTSHLTGTAYPSDLKPQSWDSTCGILVERNKKWYLPVLYTDRADEYTERGSLVKLPEIEPYVIRSSGRFKTIDMHSIVKLVLPSLEWEAPHD